MKPTSEQSAACDRFATGESLAIEAGAGTGKTSTLILLAKSTSRQGQYVAFNRSIVEEAKRKMPRNVAAATAHSLAMRAYGYKFRGRLDSPRMTSTDIAKRLKVEPISVETQDGEHKRLSAPRLAGLVMRTLIRFCQSADDAPAERHVPYINGIDVPPGRMENNTIVRQHIIGYVRAAWRDAQDVYGTLPYKHDYYLKAWQLSGPKIGADFILFDEAQDASPVLRAIVEAQTDAQKVWVGDSQQSIYGFTGAVNALAEVKVPHRTFLTQSFRFGNEIAAVANRILAALDADLRLSGLDSIPSRVGVIEDADAVLCRTNATAIHEMLDALADGRRPHLVGGGKDVTSFVDGAKKLKTEGRTDHPELACFESWDEVQRYVEQDEQGGDLRLMVKLIDEFGVDRILSALRGMPDERQADVVISTAHKAKGREWDSVRLADDFPKEPEDEELRLLYVACTRAKVALDITAVRYLSDAADAPGAPQGTLSEAAVAAPSVADVIGQALAEVAPESLIGTADRETVPMSDAVRSTIAEAVAGRADHNGIITATVAKTLVNDIMDALTTRGLVAESADCEAVQ